METRAWQVGMGCGTVGREWMMVGTKYRLKRNKLIYTLKNNKNIFKN
jgi:precorrin-6B methylase 2